jgi:hypothetical protein
MPHCFERFRFIGEWYTATEGHVCAARLICLEGSGSLGCCGARLVLLVSMNALQRKDDSAPPDSFTRSAFHFPSYFFSPSQRPTHFSADLGGLRSPSGSEPNSGLLSPILPAESPGSACKNWLGSLFPCSYQIMFCLPCLYWGYSV